MKSRYRHCRASLFLIVGLAVAAGTGCAPKQLDPAATVEGAVVSKHAVTSAVSGSGEKNSQEQLDAFVSQQLLANAAIAGKLDGQADVKSALEIATRGVLARAYERKLGAGMPDPTGAEIQAFYVEHPELFSKRRIYRLQEIAIAAPADRVDAIKSQFATLTTFRQRATWLQEQKIPFSVGASVKAAEDLPADLVVTMMQMKDGTTFYLPSPTGFTTVQITAIEERPLTSVQAQAQIRPFLHNQQLGKLIKKETERLRAAATVRYFAPYATKVAPAAN